MATISPAEYEQRIKALEKLNATLAAEADRANSLINLLYKWKQRVYGLSREPWPYEQDLLAAISTYERQQRAVTNA